MENKDNTKSHWFSNSLSNGVTEFEDQVIDGAPPGMWRYKALYSEAVDGLSNPELYYDLNDLGYRCPPFDTIDNSKMQIIQLGCSFTFGIGLGEEEHWGHYLKSAFGEDTSQIWNLAVPGWSNDAIVRTANDFIHKIKPAVIFVQWTHFNRREYIKKDNDIHRIVPNHPKYHNDASEAYKGFFGMHNRYYDQYCFEKNLMFMFNLVRAYNVNFIWEEITNFPGIDMSRDKAHPGPKSNKQFAINMYEQYLNEAIYEDEREKFMNEFLKKLDEKSTDSGM
tara:strand:- start:833 stop:1669 length:837 start_codon:yes stop_codon:yes gene_type:complete